jgi:DNA-binding transcriptional LysR family regulator
MKNVSALPETRQLRYFVAVAEALHFGRAATRLGIEQPPLSQQIRRFEQALGTPLFERTPRRRVQLTDAGRALLPEARRLLAELEHAAELTRRAGRGEVGQLAVGFTGTCAMSALLGATVRRFRSLYPGVALSLVGMHSAEQVQALRSGRLDVGLLRPPIPDPGDDYELYRLPDEPVFAALPADHPAAATDPLPLQALRDQSFIMFPASVGPGLHERLLGLCREAGFEPRIVQEAPEFTSIVGLVAAGLGVTLVPATMRALDLRGVVYRQLSDPEAKVALALVAPRSGGRGAAQRFVELMLEQAKAQAKAQAKP